MTYKVTGLKELATSFGKLGAATARGEARAVNRCGVTIIAAQSRAVVARVNLKVSRVKEAVKIRKKATPDDPSIVIEAQARGINLIEFGGTWRGRKSPGATALVLREEGRHTYDGTFIANGLGGNRLIFDRERSKPKKLMTQGRYIGQVRQQIKALFGVSVYSQFLRDDIQKVGEDTWTTRLPIELDRETAFALSQSGL